MPGRRVAHAAVRALAAAGVLVAIASASRADVIQIRMKDLVFSPAEFAARVGDTIEWINDDFLAHTATARNGDWDLDLPANATGRVVVKQAGSVEYYCRYHPNMKGKAEIKE